MCTCALLTYYDINVKTYASTSQTINTCWNFTKKTMFESIRAVILIFNRKAIKTSDCGMGYMIPAKN